MRHFDVSEFDCKCGCGGNEMSPEVMEMADPPPVEALEL